MTAVLRSAVAAWAFVAMSWPARAAEPAATSVVQLDGRPAPDASGLPALVCWQEAWQSPRPVQFHFLRLDLRHPDYEVFAIMGDDPDGDGPAETSLESPLTLAERQNAVAAVNANAFRHLPGAGEVERARGWYPGKLVDAAGLVVVDGQVRSLPDANLPLLWVGGDGQPRTDAPPRLGAVWQGVSGWIDRLLEDGHVVARPDAQLHPRTLAGVDAEGRFLLLAVADGRQKGYSEGISLPEAAAVMALHRCHHAVNLDGGGSSIMLVREPQADGSVMRTVNRPSGGRPRPIPVMLGVRPIIRPQPRP